MKPNSGSEALYQKVAAAFSRMEKPEIVALDDVESLRDLFINDPYGLAWLNVTVEALTQGAVTLMERSADDRFNLEVFGPARYLVLVGGGRRQRVIYLPSHPFFIFEK